MEICHDFLHPSSKTNPLNQKGENEINGWLSSQQNIVTIIKKRLKLPSAMRQI